jgi:hypothetical protein
VCIKGRRRRATDGLIDRLAIDYRLKLPPIRVSDIRCEIARAKLRPEPGRFDNHSTISGGGIGECAHRFGVWGAESKVKALARMRGSITTFFDGDEVFVILEAIADGLIAFAWADVFKDSTHAKNS